MENDVQGAPFAFAGPVDKLSEIVCRCRSCKRNDIPASEMAIFRWHETFGTWAGKCRNCFLNEDDERMMLD